MVKRIITIGFLSLGITFNSYANDSDRIDQLEKEIQQLDIRISKLEYLLNNLSSPQNPVTSGEGWRSVMNWRKLATDMSASDVQQILGEPDRLDGGIFATWYYQNGGMVVFYRGKVYKWTEPRQ